MNQSPVQDTRELPGLSLILVNEAARLLSVSVATVRNWERDGRLRALKTMGGVRLFDRRDVEQLARERAATSTMPLAAVR